MYIVKHFEGPTADCDYPDHIKVAHAFGDAVAFVAAHLASVQSVRVQVVAKQDETNDMAVLFMPPYTVAPLAVILKTQPLPTSTAVDVSAGIHGFGDKLEENLAALVHTRNLAHRVKQAGYLDEQQDFLLEEGGQTLTGHHTENGFIVERNGTPIGGYLRYEPFRFGWHFVQGFDASLYSDSIQDPCLLSDDQVLHLVMGMSATA